MDSGADPTRGGETAAEEAPGGDRLFTLVIALLALLPRLYVAIAWAREPVWDGHYYDFGARRIAAGLGYSDDIILDGRPIWHPWCHYPVGYSGFLGIVYRIFGGGPHVATVANALTGALLVAVVHRLARYATTQRRARIAAILAAASPGLIVYSALLMTEPLAALGTLAAAWLFARGQAPSVSPRVRMWSIVSSGITLGLTILVRPQSLLCAPALVLLAIPRRNLSNTNSPEFLAQRRKDAKTQEEETSSLVRLFCAFAPLRLCVKFKSFKSSHGFAGNPLKRAVVDTVIATAVAVAVVAPWTARNCRVMDGCALVSTNGGWNLAIGAFPRATGRFETLRGTDGCPIVTGQVQQDRCWLHEGLGWIAGSPGRWIGLMPKKLSFTFDHESFPMGYLGEADPARWPEERKARGREILSGAHRVLLGAAALGVIALPIHRRWRDRLAQIALLGIALFLGAQSIWADLHPAWPLALFIPAAAALPIPGRPRSGGVIGYLAFAIASVALTHAVFFGEDRYHMVVTPALCILAAAALRRPAGEAAASAPR
ncbi:MAG: glycosyltransferase family 39 protein [Byssovorax sp.]